MRRVACCQAGVEVGRCELMDDKMVKIINDANGFEVRHSSVTHKAVTAGHTHGTPLWLARPPFSPSPPAWLMRPSTSSSSSSSLRRHA